MSDIDFQKFEKSTSRARLQVYRKPGDDNLDVMCKYLWNMCLCESLYPVLNTLEVSARNSIASAMTVRHGAMWFNSTELPFNGYQYGQIQTAKDELAKQQRPVTPGGVVAELSFGFWTSMFSSHMDRAWRGLLKNAIPFAPPHCRSVPHIRETLVPLRQFRNRVFHHERILHWNPTHHYHECKAVIGWISDVKLKAFGLIDRFPEVYAGGLLAIKSAAADSGDDTE